MKRRFKIFFIKIIYIFQGGRHNNNNDLKNKITSERFLILKTSVRILMQVNKSYNLHIAQSNAPAWLYFGAGRGACFHAIYNTYFAYVVMNLLKPLEFFFENSTKYIYICTYTHTHSF